MNVWALATPLPTKPDEAADDNGAAGGDRDAFVGTNAGSERSDRYHGL